jgi:hypothetical protein
VERTYVVNVTNGQIALALTADVDVAGVNALEIVRQGP